VARFAEEAPAIERVIDKIQVEPVHSDEVEPAAGD
jgi:hypothetical protein